MNQDMVKMDHFDGNNFCLLERQDDVSFHCLEDFRFLTFFYRGSKPTIEGGQPSAKAIERVNKEKRKREDDELVC